MSIRQLAKDLYQVCQRIDNLKKELSNSEDGPQKEALLLKLKQLETEKQALQERLNKMKSKPLPI